MKSIITDKDKKYVISFERYNVYDENEDMLGLYQVVLRDENEATLVVIGAGGAN